MKPLKPVENNETVRVGTIKEAQERYRFGRRALLEIAEKCGALIRIGSGERDMIRINFPKMDKYFDNFKEDK